MGVTAPCAALTAKGQPCPIAGEYPYRDRLLVCHVHNPEGRYATQHPNFRRKVMRMLDALLDGQPSDVTVTSPISDTERAGTMSEKNDALLATAHKSGAFQTAAVELLIWLGKDIPVHPDREYGTYVDTDALQDRLGVWSGGERRVASVALSLLDAGKVDLRDVIGGTGGEHRRRIVAAIAAAAQ